ncbi:MAG: hypothetical protein MRQ09_02065 [Candidatus Midichloria sp.]|nr:hypothetical protein [Candidatus Midichloria sp.]
MKKQEISYENLSVLLVTAYSLQLNTQKFHWNLIGANFYILHKFSELLYKDLAESIDQMQKGLGRWVMTRLLALQNSKN